MDMSRFKIFLLSCVVIAGCRGAPVQEMSDARQAIAAAHGAGLSGQSSPELRVAETDMVRAETHLGVQQYTRARIAARDAKHHAATALSNAAH